MGRGEQRATSRRKLDRLRALKVAGGAALAAYVTELVADDRDPEVLEAALAALPSPPPRELAQPLRDAWEWFASSGKRRDPGGFVRTRILQTLAPIATQADRDAFIAAIGKYERTPQDPAGPGVLRAAGVAGLHRFDPESAAPFAASLLSNRDGISPMTGEPAVTAARVLFATGHELTLFVYAMAVPRLHADVLGECVRSMEGLPEPLRAECVAKFATDPDPVVLLGVCDLVVAARMAEAASGLLRSLEDTEVYASLVAAMVASRDAGLAAALLSHAKTVTAREKLVLLADSLGLMRGDAGADEVLESVRRRLDR